VKLERGTVHGSEAWQSYLLFWRSSGVLGEVTRNEWNGQAAILSDANQRRQLISSSSYENQSATSANGIGGNGIDINTKCSAAKYASRARSMGI
jgi:hypothetical protein